MARKQYARQFGKIFAAVLLLIVTVIGFSYGSLLRGMDRATVEYGEGDVEAALERYQTIEQRLRSLGALRLIPGKDRGTLILNQARLLYALGRYDDAEEAMDREAEIAGTTSNDSRFLLLKGEIAFRKAVRNYRESAEQDQQLLEEALRIAENYLRDSLRLAPNDWDAKYNFEYISYIRDLMNRSRPGMMPMLMMSGGNEDVPPTTLPAELSP